MNTDPETTLTIPAADPSRPPLKENLFFVARAAASQLNPLVPYMDRGSIVPCTASFRSGPAAPPIGHFQHQNHVDEVAVVYGSTGDMRTGDVFVGAKKHGVGGWGERGEFFTTMVITQRQVEDGPQPEAHSYVCEKCSATVSNHEYDGLPAEGKAYFPPLPTTEESFKSALMFNRSEESRTCKSCGHVNRAFPTHIWGWDRYMFNTGVVNQARAALEEASKA